MSQLFRKKPVVIRALKWTGSNVEECLAFCEGNAKYINAYDGPYQLIIKTLEDGYNGYNGIAAKHVATVGDWIIKGVEGEFYFCKPDIFEKTYEAMYDGKG